MHPLPLMSPSCYPKPMQIAVNENLFQSYLDAELDSEMLDAFVNQRYFQLPIDTKRMAKLVSTLGPSNAYRKVLLEALSQEEKESYASIATGFGLDEIEDVDVTSIINNPYYQALINLKPFKEGNVSYYLDDLKAYELFLSQDKGQDPLISSNEKTILGFIHQDIKIPTLKQGEQRWMSLLPHELHTMAKSIEEAIGNVLIYGAGIGYYSYMCDIKEEVTSLTIIENDPKILSLFKEHFLPLFPYKEKVTLILGDALAYNQRNDIHYDYCFVDIYHGEVDGFPLYCNLKASEGIADKTSYWIEGALLAYFRRHLIVFLEEQIYEGYDESVYLEDTSTPSAKLLLEIYRVTKEASIHSEEELVYFLSDAHLKEMAKKIGKLK